MLGGRLGSPSGRAGDGGDLEAKESREGGTIRDEACVAGLRRGRRERRCDWDRDSRDVLKPAIHSPFTDSTEGARCHGRYDDEQANEKRSSDREGPQ